MKFILFQVFWACKRWNSCALSFFGLQKKNFMLSELFWIAKKWNSCNLSFFGLQNWNSCFLNFFGLQKIKLMCISRRMRRKVFENMKFIPFVKNDFETKVANETIHSLGVADQKIFSDWIFDPFLKPKTVFCVFQFLAW